jgi:hypothetical protein
VCRPFGSVIFSKTQPRCVASQVFSRIGAVGKAEPGAAVLRSAFLIRNDFVDLGLGVVMGDQR